MKGIRFFNSDILKRKRLMSMFLLFFGAIFNYNCNNSSTLPPVRILDVDVNNSEEYTLDILMSGDEEGATITKQAEHFLVSEIIRDSLTQGNIVYKYIPLDYYIGKDCVEIETKSCIINEDITCNTTEIIKIRINIKN